MEIIICVLLCKNVTTKEDCNNWHINQQENYRKLIVHYKINIRINYSMCKGSIYGLNLFKKTHHLVVFDVVDRFLQIP